MTGLRRRMFWAAAALYVVALPFLLAFAFGIDVDAERAEPVVATASLEVSTVPEGVEVSLSEHGSGASPAVFDGLHAGAYSFTVRAPGAREWSGSLRAEPGLAFVVAQLRMVSEHDPRELAVLSAGSDPLPLDQGRAVAYVPPGGRELVVATIRHDGLTEERVELPPGFGAEEVSLRYLPLSGQLVVARPSEAGIGYVIDVRGLESTRFANRTFRAIPVPAAAVELLAVPAEQGSVVTLEPQGIRRASDAADAFLVQYRGSLVAFGYVRGAWYALDSTGSLYQHGHPLLPARVAELDARECCGDTASDPPLRLLYASEQAAVCFAPASRTLLVLTRDRAPVRYVAIDGGCAAQERPGTWLWRGGELYAQEGAEAPRAIAALASPITGIREEFCPRHVAVETEGGIYLLPAEAAREQRVRCEPLLLAANPPGTRTLACREGVLLRVSRDADTLTAYSVVWYEP